MRDVIVEDLLPTRAMRHAEERPDQRVLSFLDSSLEVVASLTCRQLDHRARAVAAQLLERGLGGAPVILAFPNGLDFITAFCGCLYAGAIAAPATLPRSHRSNHRLAAILEDTGSRCVLTSAAHSGELSDLVRSSAQPVDVLATDLLLSPRTDDVPVPAAAGHHLAFLQYTSGSTRSPRGVMVRHGDLAANLNTCRAMLDADHESVGVSWLPLFHDLGLIAGVLLSLWVGYPTYLMAPTTFIRNPISWLTAFSRLGGTHGCAPNFAYDACVDAAVSADTSELDLSSWRTALNGAEPVHADTIERFRKRFAPNGFRAQTMSPAYGLAEATLVVSGSDGSRYPADLTVDESELHLGGVRLRDDAPGAKRLAGSGRPAPGFDVRIVRPDVRRLAEPQTLGEIWVRGNSVTQGYWDKPAETAETFGGYLNTGEGPYLRTGDLGFLHDGELFVIGRLKDMIVIRGVNYYPHDIEHTIERSHPALQPAGAAVVGVDVSGQVILVALQEIRRDRVESASGDEVVDAIRRAVARDHALTLQRVVLLHPGGLPKTSSGKVQRAKCRTELDGSVLPVLYNWRAPVLGGVPFHFEAESLRQPGALERRLGDWLQGELSLENLTWRTPLTELGVDSLKGVELVNVLSAAFDHTFPATSMLDHPTVASLASLIRNIKLGTAPTEGLHHNDFAYTAEQIEAFDERQLTDALRQRIAEVLDGRR